MRRLLKRVRNYITLLKFKILYKKRFIFDWSCRLSSSVKIRMDKTSCLCLGKSVILREGVIININNGGKVNLEDGVFINDYCCINSRDQITIGKESLLGQAVKIYDHDHDYKGNDFREKFKTQSISIGNRTWIGSNVVILRGSRIGNECVVGAGTIAKLQVPDRSLIIPNRDVSIMDTKKYML